MKLLARESTPVRIEMSDDGMELVAITQDVGQARESLERSYAGAKLTVAFNPQYLLDGLEVTPGDEISLTTIDALKPALVRAIEVRGLPLPADAGPGLLIAAGHPGRGRDASVLVTRLWLTDFRCYERLELDLSPGLTAIARPQRRWARPTCWRPSAYLATLESFRGAPADALVRRRGRRRRGAGRGRA